MTEVVEKLLLIAFGLFILFLILGWAVPEITEINEQREETGETEETEGESPQGYNEIDAIDLGAEKLRPLNKEIKCGKNVVFVEKTQVNFYFRDLIKEVF